MGRRAPRCDDRRLRRRGACRAEGVREARHPPRTGQGRHRDHVRRRLRRRAVAPRRTARAGAGRVEKLMPTMNMIQALNDPHKVMMRADDDIVVFGEDIGFFGGVFRVTEGLQKEFGHTRVFDAPISEGGIVACAVGMAAYGIKPVIEIQFADYIYPGYDQIVSEVAKMRYRTAGEWPMPMVIRTPYGGGIFGGQTHSQSPESLFTHIAGLKVIIPSTPYDAKGLLIAAIEDPDPVIFFEPKRIYNGPFDGHHDRPVKPWSKHPASEVPEGHYKVPLGKAAIVREGEAVTVLAYGTMVHVALAAVEERGIDAEVIDLRTLVPLDIETIEQSVEKTGRCLVVQEAPKTSGFASELVAQVQERCFYHLEAPVERVTGWDTPYPHAYEWAYFPGPKRMKKALEKVMAD